MNKIKKISLLTSDILALYFALIITLIVRYSSDFSFHLDIHIRSFSVIFPIWIIIFLILDLYTYKTLRNKKTVFQNLLLATIIAGITSVIAFYLFPNLFRLTPKTNMAIFSFVFLVLDYFFRMGILKIFTAGAFKIAVLGESRLIDKTLTYLEKTPHSGYQTLLYIKDKDEPRFKQFAKEIKENKIDFVIIQDKLIKNFSVLRAIYKLLSSEVGVINFCKFYEEIFEKAPLEELEESWFVENVSIRRKTYDTIKRIADVFLAIVFLLTLLPVVFIIAILILAFSGNPIIYKQERVGKNNKTFVLYKFRTMKSKKDGPLWTKENDERITKIGKILRASHLDELPQLINIIKGEISFTGPRPERVELAKKYEEFPFYEMRHLIKPGLTGWAQINFRPSASLGEAFEKLCYDIYYIQNRSFLLDLLIILKTIRYLVAGARK